MPQNPTITGDTCKDKFPNSPELDTSKFPKPMELSDEYYKTHLPEDKIKAIDEKKEGLLSEANLTKETTLAGAEVIKQEVQSAFDIAKKKFETDKKLLDAQTINKKSQHFRNYHQELRDALPKNLGLTQKKDVEELVPDDKKAIIIANLNKNLANEEVEYRKKFKDYSKALAEAENKLKLAMDDYDADLCIANAQEACDSCSAEIAWRQDISTALAEINN
jgi:hypothetical protein